MLEMIVGAGATLDARKRCRLGRDNIADMIRAWNAQREKDKKTPHSKFIDEVWTNVKP